MNKKFRKLTKELKPEIRDIVRKTIPEEYQKQFAKFVLREGKLKPFFVRWFARTEEARYAFEYIVRQRDVKANESGTMHACPGV